MSLGLSILITCKNEAHNIGACIESVRGLGDEIVVADSGSTDNTLDVVRAAGGCRIIEREFYVSAGNFKNWAIPQLNYPWVLVVDSDERLTPELAAEIRSVLSGPPNYDSYGIRFRTFFFGREIKYCGWNTNRSVRLFRRAVCRYNELRVHSDIVTSTGKVGALQSKFLHYTYQSLSRYVDRMHRYCYWSAADKYAAGRRVTVFGIVGRPLARFFYIYIFRLGFLDGLPGLLICLLTMYYVYLKYALLWEMCHCDVAPQFAGPAAFVERRAPAAHADSQPRSAAA
jgi:glycosyltransferase involved in cell wall biosynthesis